MEIKKSIIAGILFGLFFITNSFLWAQNYNFCTSGGQTVRFYKKKERFHEYYADDFSEPGASEVYYYSSLSQNLVLEHSETRDHLLFFEQKSPANTDDKCHDDYNAYISCSSAGSHEYLKNSYTLKQIAIDYFSGPFGPGVYNLDFSSRYYNVLRINKGFVGRVNASMTYVKDKNNKGTCYEDKTEDWGQASICVLPPSSALPAELRFEGLAAYETASDSYEKVVAMGASGVRTLHFSITEDKTKFCAGELTGYRYALYFTGTAGGNYAGGTWTSELPMPASGDINIDVNHLGYYKVEFQVKDKYGNWYTGRTFGNTTKGFSVSNISVVPECHDDNPKIFVTGSGINQVVEGGYYETKPGFGGYEIKKGGEFYISIAGAPDFLDYYKLVSIYSDGTSYSCVDDDKLCIGDPIASAIYDPDVGSYVPTTRYKVTLNDDVEIGSFQIFIRKKSTNAFLETYCETFTTPIRVFVGGYNVVFPHQACLIVLPDDLGDIFPPDVDWTTWFEDYTLNHFKYFVSSNSGIVVKDGVTLTFGARLYVEDVSMPDELELQADKDKNWIRSINYDDQGRVIAESKSYYSSSGKLVQSQTKNLSDSYVLATHTKYDSKGRQMTQSLPAPISTVNSDLEVVKNCDPDRIQIGQELALIYDETFADYSDNTNDFSVAEYYSDLNPIEDFVATTNYPYSQNIYNEDGTNEVNSVVGAGDAYRDGSGNPQNVAKSSTVSILTDDMNIQNYLSLWDEVDDYHFLGESKPSTYIERGSIKIGTDANDVTNKVKTYLDNKGQAIITVHELSGDRSFNYYDAQGRLAVSFTPQGVYDKFNASKTYAQLDKVSYQYDLNGNISSITSNDAGTTRFLYRRDGKVRFSQNSKQVSSHSFTYTNYDRYGRVTEMGEYTPSGSSTDWPNLSDASILEYKDDNPALDPLNNVMNGSKGEAVRTHYSLPDGASPIQQKHTRGLVSFTEKVNGSGVPLSKTWYSYDEEGRIVQMAKYLGKFPDDPGTPTIDERYKTFDYYYGPAGEIRVVAYQYGKPDGFLHYYQYDKDKRLKKVYTSDEVLTHMVGDPAVEENIDLTKSSIDLFTESLQTLQLEAEYFYYIHGPLKRVEVADDLQGVDYLYTVEGWLKSINHPDLTVANDPGGDDGLPVQQDVFGMSLEYYSGDYSNASVSLSSAATTNYYNGNINAVRWKRGDPDFGDIKMYEYSYDDEYQLAGATYGTNTGTFTPSTEFKVNNLSYDANGNISALTRTYNSGGQADDIFAYNYANAGKVNQLSSITNDGNGFKQYSYDAIGRMIQEYDAEISASKYLDYNVNGLVVGVYADLGHTQPIVKFEYDENGFRTVKLSYNNSYVLSDITHYVRGDAGQLFGLYTQAAGANSADIAEMPIYGSGRLGTLYKGGSDEYVYDIKDHLGNIRVRMQRVTVDPLVGYADYYPFGLRFPSVNNPDDINYPFNTKNTTFGDRHDYQGDNSEKDPETGWNAFKLRMYDARVGRWLTTDPESQFVSPYVGVGNDPVSRTDPTGGYSPDDITVYSDGSQKIVETDDNFDRIYYTDLDNVNLVWNTPKTTFIGKFSKNDIGLIEFRGITTEDFGISVKPTTIRNESNYIQGTALAALIGVAMELKAPDLTITRFSNADGSSPGNSVSHLNGFTGDIRYLRNDMSGGPLEIGNWEEFDDFDYFRNTSLTQALNKFGWTSILSERDNIWNEPFLLPNTTHYSGYYDRNGIWNSVRHNDHLHLQHFHPTYRL